ncbi:hypothetical protein GCK72_004924 [Caenorhabditis remanei]|uniref:F-box domain-containing protein n=1 Tax=Caenorhabditis remanei TaxID=31234 RepID=A0A6A5HF37_CAERE|nr:hypothetical protein GCK72_004924 [Caenorhabditis remanei]KAF1764973.1 hypothetical protein GCK72_004924 [Caenorhabditis remanei]
MSPLPILNLPDSAADLVVKLLNFREKVQLCMTSKRSATIVERAKVKVKYINTHMEDRRSITKIFETELPGGNYHITMFYSNMSKFLKSSEREQHRKVINPIQENINHARRLLETFEVKEFNYSVCVKNKTSGTLEEYLKRVVAMDYDFIEFTGFTFWEASGDFLDTKDLSLILKTVKPEARLSIESTISLDFKHDNPFNFKSVHYMDGGWVTMDVLKSIRHSGSVELDRTNFSCKDINEYIHYWVNSEEDIIRDLSIGVNRKLKFNEQELLNKLAFATCKAKNNENRNFTFAQVSYDIFCPYKIKIVTDEPEIRLSAYIFKHLEDIEEIQKLNEVREKIEELEMKCMEVLEEETSDTEKERIRKELEIVVKTRNLIETRLDAIRSQWKNFLTHFYAVLLRLAGVTNTTLPCQLLLHCVTNIA